MEKSELKKLLSLMTAYQRSRLLFTIVELRIPTRLDKGPLTAAELAKILKIEPLAMERLLCAATSAGLLKRSGKRFSNRAVAAEFLVEGKEFYLGGQIERQMNRSYRVWNDLTEKLRDWRPGSDKNAVPAAADQDAGAMDEQHRLALFQGHELAKEFDFSKFGRILDLGGGTGATSIALCERYSGLKSIVFDLPRNAEIARRYIRQHKMQDRIRVIGGNFRQDELPNGFDSVLLANFMSVADAAENQKLLRTIFRKLPAGGLCLLSGWIIDNSRLSPSISLLFCLEDICWDAPDVERSERVYTKWLKNAGFANIKCRTYLEPTKMLYGFKPGDADTR